MNCIKEIAPSFERVEARTIKGKAERIFFSQRTEPWVFVRLKFFIRVFGQKPVHAFARPFQKLQGPFVTSHGNPLHKGTLGEDEGVNVQSNIESEPHGT